MSEPFGDYFKEKILQPLREWKREADTNKRFYLGEKSYEFISTLTGHEPFELQDTAEGSTKSPGAGISHR